MFFTRPRSDDIDIPEISSNIIAIWRATKAFSGNGIRPKILVDNGIRPKILVDNGIGT